MAENGSNELVDGLARQRAQDPGFGAWLQQLAAAKLPLPAVGELRQRWEALQARGPGAKKAPHERPPAPGALARALALADDAVWQPPWLYLALRLEVGQWRYLRLHVEHPLVESIALRAFLAAKERLVLGDTEPYPWPLELDFGVFRGALPRARDARGIGQGLTQSCHWLAERLARGGSPAAAQLVAFLGQVRHRGRPLLLQPELLQPEPLRQALARADAELAAVASSARWPAIEERLSALGFAPGWGGTAGRARETMRLLSDLLAAPDTTGLQRLFARLPLVTSVVVISPHGFFGQAHVLGRADTGGQVVYILDQVRALEGELRRRFADQGLEIDPQIIVVTRLIPESPSTTCSEPIEAIGGTRHAHIMRVPFRDRSGEVVPQWISRFELWPYLEDFAAEVERELLAELGGPPSLLLGNYSDGNLVAWLIAQRQGVTLGSVAHALEKTKRPHADLEWRRHDRQYHFGCQVSADLLAMNGADFVVVSSFQELAGTAAGGVGQYESHAAFTLPGLYRVVDGVDPFDARFNILPPGADPAVYFPYDESARRFTDLHTELEELLYGDDVRPDARGVLEDRDKPLLFAITRLDRVKNISGLVEWFGRSPRLREQVNLLVVAGRVDPGRTDDDDERGQIERLHDLMDEHQLDGQLRWLGLLLEKALVGELYRYVADSRGAFVQPAVHEGFGLTVIEAMSCGLPTFATCHGGPREIIEDGSSGFHLDPAQGEQAAERMAEFFERCRDDPARWTMVSRAALERVELHYNWARYAERLVTLTQVSRCCGQLAAREREPMARYLETFYTLQLRPLMKQVPRRDYAAGPLQPGRTGGD
ncbi:MAG: sucrose synthase [Proteobacteria bacterium]|nr:sucrose synthase [Pseudomonadota bacterium]